MHAQVRHDTATAVALARQLDKYHKFDQLPFVSQEGAGIDGVLAAAESAIAGLASNQATSAGHDGSGGGGVGGVGGGGGQDRLPQRTAEFARLDLVVSYLVDVHCVDYYGGRGYPDRGALTHHQRVAYKRYPESYRPPTPPFVEVASNSNDADPEASRKRGRLEKPDAAAAAAAAAAEPASAAVVAKVTAADATTTPAAQPQKEGEQVPWTKGVARLLQITKPSSSSTRRTAQQRFVDACREKRRTTTQEFQTKYVCATATKTYSRPRILTTCAVCASERCFVARPPRYCQQLEGQDSWTVLWRSSNFRRPPIIQSKVVRSGAGTSPSNTTASPARVTTPHQVEATGSDAATGPPADNGKDSVARDTVVPITPMPQEAAPDTETSQEGTRDVPASNNGAGAAVADSSSPEAAGSSITKSLAEDRDVVTSSGGGGAAPPPSGRTATTSDSGVVASQTADDGKDHQADDNDRAGTVSKSPPPPAASGGVALAASLASPVTEQPQQQQQQEFPSLEAAQK